MNKLALASCLIILLLTGCGDKDHPSNQATGNKEVSSGVDNNQSQEDTDNNRQEDIQGDSSERITENNTKENDGSKQDQNKNNETQSDQRKEVPQNDQISQSSDKVVDHSKQDSVSVVGNPTAITVMVNKSNALPKGYRPNDLVRPKVKFTFGSQQLDKALMRAEAADALERMFNQASSNGIQLYAASGFRSYETQEYLFNREIEQVGRQKAELAVAKPGTSEHQTGLTMDISAASMNYTLDESFEHKPEGKWLAEHAHEYGFILRYPKGKENITKYQFEPWHFRYVGKEIATEIYHKGITLEEYFQNKKGI
ncbi:M15 family metallopeptidase [Heyndrickxia oleronia]|uniref:M15 family metallopeptidase n=1 Tax=Heyndrickxia oleronia TaxID=38875 RepID=UPI001B03E616|nr:M15 family metallopeptidase [Heyndrickxia oleronia]GIN41725.1 D-alanyl-D-alanine carboxypeptidase [Heyndrickxia oleronia]